VIYQTRIWIIVTVALTCGAGTLLVGPIPQDPAYHLFADLRGCRGIPNFGNVASNIGFSLVGVIGLWLLLGQGPGRQIGALEDMLPYVAFLIAIALIGAGSAYYHWQPNNQTLFWDRLPMTVGFMALTAAIVADRIHRKAGIRIMLPVLVAVGIASLFYWSVTEAAGRGDLRFYGLVQFLPMILIPLVCWLFPKARYTNGRYVAGMILCYALAKIFELADFQIFDLTGGLVSGHTLKHLVAAVATACVIPMVRSGRALNEGQI